MASGSQNMTTYLAKGLSKIITNNAMNTDNLLYINTTDTSITADMLAATNSIAFTRMSTTGAYTTGHMVWLNAANIGTPFQLVVHDSSDLYLYKRWSSSGTWTAWSKMKAGTADTWTTARTLTIGETGKSVDGSANVSWSKDEILGASTNAYFLRGDKAWSNTLNGIFTANGNITANNGMLKSTANSNTVTIGSQNANFTHIYNSANIPFIFNNTVESTGGDLGTTSYPWHNIYIGTANGAGIYYKGTKDTYRMIRFIDNTSDTNGNGISIGGGGLTLIGSGESADTLISNLNLTTSGGTETLYVASDGSIEFYPGQQSYSAAARIWMTAGVLNIGVDGNTTRENSLNIYSGAGRVQLYSGAATSGNRGLWFAAHGTGSAKSVITVNTNNNVNVTANEMYTDTIVTYSSAGFISSAAGSPWPYIRFDTRAGGSTYVTTAQTSWCELYAQVPAKRNSTYYKTRFFFRQYSKTANTTTRLSYYEDYYLPETNDGRTDNASYNILTTKDMSFSITGNAATATTASALAAYDSIGSSTTDHGVALKNWFTANKSTAPRNQVISFYSATGGNGSQYMGYFLSGYANNPYGGFFVCHYNNPYYVGISNGTYTQQHILTSTNYTSYTVTKTGSGASGTWGISITGNAATATKATQDGSGNTITSKYVTLDTSETITGTKTFQKRIIAYAYKQATNLPFITFDKPGSNSTGIGPDGTNNRIKFGPCDLAGTAWVAQSSFNSNDWFFQGSIHSTSWIQADGALWTGRSSTYYVALGGATRYGWIDFRTGSEVMKQNIVGYSDCVVISRLSYTSGSHSSSRLIKQNIAYLNDADARKLLQLRPISYKFKEQWAYGDTSRHIGLIAEEVLPILPEVVDVPENYSETRVLTKECRPMSISYEEIVPYLIKLAQMQQREIDALKLRVAQLSNT